MSWNASCTRCCSRAIITHIHVPRCYSATNISSSKQKQNKKNPFLSCKLQKTCHPGTINSSTEARTIFWIDQNQYCHVPAPVAQLNLESRNNKPGGELYTWLHERGLLPSDSTASPSLDASHFFRPALPKCLFPQPRACTSITPNHHLVLSCNQRFLQQDMFTKSCSFFVSFSSCAAQVSFLRKLLSKAVHRRSQVLRIFFSRSSKLREERKKLILEYCGPQIISL